MEESLKKLHAVIGELPVPLQEKDNWARELDLAGPDLSFLDKLEKRVRELAVEYEQLAEKKLVDLDAKAQSAVNTFQALDREFKYKAQQAYTAQMAQRHTDTLDVVRKKLQEI